MKLKCSFFDLKRKSGDSAVHTEEGVKIKDTALVLFRTLSVRPFNYPFGSEGKVREAIRMSVTPLLGDGGDLAVVPLFLEKTKNSSYGCVFAVSGSELKESERELSSDTAVWPAPLAFISEVGGSGLVICIRDGIQGMLFEEGMPVLSYWMAEGDMEGWFNRYAESSGRTIKKVFTADLRDMDPGQAEKGRSASLSVIPGLKDFTLSHEAAKKRAGADSFMSAAFPVIKAAAVAGTIFSVFAWMFFIHGWTIRDKFESLPSAAYLKVFGEPSTSPVRTALKKAALVPEEGSSATLEEALGAIAYAFKESGRKLKVESFRYGPAVSEVQGSAESAEAAERFRASIAQRGFSAKMSDIRQIPAAGMRFTIAFERKDSK